ncbi:MAG: hypothetical protein QW222_03735 [Candidatus Bathyarchaeia archaeon]
MPFKVRATLIAFRGDTARYPCHFLHRVGDEIVFDGEKLIGRICPDALERVYPVMFAVRYAGARYRGPIGYAPFIYSHLSIEDPGMKKFDGVGFRPVKESVTEAPYTLGALMRGPGTLPYPPPGSLEKKPRDVIVFCPDLRTAAVFKIEAFDLSDRGFDVPYFRRQMVILHKIMQKPGIEKDRIFYEFTQEEREDIYPPLFPLTLQALLEELELIGYVEIKNEKVFITEKGRVKLDEFKENLTIEEKAALKLQ